MTLIGCFVAPHPPIMIPEVGGRDLADVDATVRSMRTLRDRVASLDPDTIVLLSPHAPLAARQMGVSFASSYSGSLAYFRAPGVTLSAPGDQELAQAIVDQAAINKVPTTITASHKGPVMLDHGSMVPLVYLMGGLARPCGLVLLSFSQLSYEEHVRFGEAVGEALMGSSQRVVYVASSDMSHRLIPGAPAGYDPRGAEFDRQVVDAFAAGDWQGLLSIQPGLIMAAGECGYRSLAVLSGVVAAARAAGLRTYNRLLSYEGPFGVGYMVAEVELAEAGEAEGVEQAVTAEEAAGAGQTSGAVQAVAAEQAATAEQPRGVER